MRLTSTLLSAVAALAISVTAANAQVVVSSKIDTEGGVLGNIIKQVLEANDIAVEDRIQLGGTPIVRQAITAGEIDIYPEYTGNAAFFFEKADDPVWKNADDAYQQAKTLDYDANKIVWLTPSPSMPRLRRGSLPQTRKSRGASCRVVGVASGAKGRTPS